MTRTSMHTSAYIHVLYMFFKIARRAKRIRLGHNVCPAFFIRIMAGSQQRLRPCPREFSGTGQRRFPCPTLSQFQCPTQMHAHSSPHCNRGHLGRGLATRGDGTFDSRVGWDLDDMSVMPIVLRRPEGIVVQMGRRISHPRTQTRQLTTILFRF